MTNEANSANTCPICAVGRLQPRRVTFARFYGGTLIHIPNVSAQVCDACGVTIPEQQAIQRVETLIGQTGPPPNRHHNRPTAPSGDELPTRESPPADPRPRRRD